MTSGFIGAQTIPKQLNDVTDEDGDTTTGLKTLWKATQNEIAASLLAPSDWRVVKELEVNSSFSAAKTAYPTEWQTYRAAVRTACNTRQTEIDNCSDVCVERAAVWIGNDPTASRPMLMAMACRACHVAASTDEDGNGGR